MKSDKDSWKLYQAAIEACKNDLSLTIETDKCTYTFTGLQQLSCEVGKKQEEVEVIVNQEADYYVSSK